MFQYTLAGSHVNLGHVLRDTGRIEASLDHYRQAIELLQPLWERKYDNPSVPLFLRNAHWGRAEALQRLQRHAETLTDLDRALELDAKKEIRTLPAIRVISLIRVAKTPEQLTQATAQTEQLLRSGGWPAARIYDFAVVYALAASRTEDATQKKAWTSQALSMFRQLLKTNAAMWKPRLESDRDLDGLRSRDDFKALLAEKPKP